MLYKEIDRVAVWSLLEPSLANASLECVTHLAAKSGEYIGISPLTIKRVQPRKDSATCHHLLICKYSSS